MFRTLGGGDALPVLVRSRLTRVAWISSALVLISGVAWFLFQAAQTLELPPTEVLSDAAALTLPAQTDFGHVWIARLLLLALLAAMMLLGPALVAGARSKRLAPVLVSAALVGTLAWAGHGAAGVGVAGAVHLAGDLLHLIAAAAWVGALVPLAIFLNAARAGDESSNIVASEGIRRFSHLGTISVITLVLTGIINSWALVGSVKALIDTDYGRLLLLKLMLLFAMLATAGVNRLVLTPRVLHRHGKAAQTPLRQLTANSAIEAALGGLILIIVSVMGTLPPGSEQAAIK